MPKLKNGPFPESTSMNTPLKTDVADPFVPHGHFTLPPTQSGPLSGLKFAAKDIFDVAGHPTGAGNPRWLETHPVPDKHSPVVARLLDHGAELCGKTLTDELAYSIHGDNIHYGMPVNPAAPDRIPGGSSSGSVSAVASRTVDFALGTDTGGSTRVPASYCGVWGLRTTHGLISREGLVPLHPSFDTVTWFAHAADTFLRVGESLLPESTFSPERLFVFDDAAKTADGDFLSALNAVKQHLTALLDIETSITAGAPVPLDEWRKVYVTAGAYEGRQTHGEWISGNSPNFAPPIAARWAAAAQITQEQAQLARSQQDGIRRHVCALLGNNSVAILPSAASVAPLRNADTAIIEETRIRTMRICCIAGLSGLPQISIPLANDSGLPIGVSLLGPAGSDLALIRLAINLYTKLTRNCGNLLKTK